MDLTSKDRKHMPSDVFALPSKRMFPMPDANHVRLANDMLERAKGLSDEERAEARRNIMKRAKELEIDTSTWKNVHAEVRASAIAVQPSQHPNRMPFSGLFTWLDAASDYAPNGSGGRKVYIPKDVGIPALSSLEGMAVNYASDDPTRHAPQQKIGVITAAWAGDPDVDGAIPVYVEGYIYAHDFPDVAAEIKAFQSALGFSYETAQTVLKAATMGDEEVAVTESIGYFTGASILFKSSAAYTNTALAANKKEGDNVDLQDILDAINSLKEYVDQKFEAFKAEDKFSDTVQDAQDDQDDQDDSTSVAASSDAQDATDDQGDQASNADDATDVTDAQDGTDDSDVADDTSDVQASQDAVDVESLKTELAAMKTQIEALQAQNTQLSAQRRSIAYPQTLAAKFDVKDEADDKDTLMASISERKDLSIEERLALKMEQLAKQRNKA